ncbi:hypothetical protein B5M47_01110 [candidate division CPR3 bacterium 4484_211]|uniref:Polymerase/histidinol phosphatase N-terminal domain-containing protein n=1 Tax=candidate division CPR3 bacterium 4484_211 TaxID=1968527 RepID=A0A1W9P0I1_UNCC3|nr:MAG: hypothetical protein B5M47_01110 [candidate division CPR3 bacterium 4484_211]
MKKYRLEFHLHTNYSYDAVITIEDLVKARDEGKFDIVCITDHDTAEGALEIKGKNLFPVIAGEEITSADGHLIGLFLKETIPPNLPAEETIARIKDQGGLVYSPHPFDFRNLGLGKKIYSLASQVDIIEAFNGAGDFFCRNHRAKKFADDYHLPGVAGSDAHFPDEIGTCTTLVQAQCIDDIMTPKGLLSSLDDCDVDAQYHSIFKHAVEQVILSIKNRGWRVVKQGFRFK